jgi:hypothetical protein
MNHLDINLLNELEETKDLIQDTFIKQRQLIEDLKDIINTKNMMIENLIKEKTELISKNKIFQKIIIDLNMEKIQD